ncbi:sugar phosphate isomerase/epimerase [Malonomonas rubra]|uniref:sugar phosphate isomerase/epimerase family protein n=1 Tax=Malonomonas rubra TaxID=57040 RepID=UPI0026EB5489|nr:sugar phosphate isomerase/epimerase family protein [Malonomonas rubra]
MQSLLFAHTPAQLLPARMPFLLNRKLQPEVACQEVRIEKLDLAAMADCASQLAEKQLKTTVHAPFSDFNPGNPKKRLRITAHSICQQSLQLAAALGAGLIVFHPGIPYQAPPKTQESWLKYALEFWPEYIEQAKQQGTIITVENIYERQSVIFEQLFADLGCNHFGHCFDIGHWNIFADQPLDNWFLKLGKHMKHLHLHDNLGETDQHLSIGSGDIDFTALFQQVQKLPAPPSMTLEAHNLPDLELSLQQIQPYLK